MPRRFNELAVLVLACCLGASACQAAAPEPRVDAPYVEIVSTRYAGSPGVVGWPSPPFVGEASQVEAIANGAQGGFAVVADGAVWNVALPVVRSSSTPGMLSPNASDWNYPAVWTKFSGLPTLSGSDRIVVGGGLDIVGVVTGASEATSAFVPVKCDASTSSCSGAGDKVLAGFAFGQLYGAAMSSDGSSLWVACDAGLAVWLKASGKFAILLNALHPHVNGPIKAVQLAGNGVFCGNGNYVWRFDVSNPAAAPEMEWVTVVSSGAGGVYASNITAFAYDDASGTLYVGTPTALNVRYANGSVARVDGLHGLPYPNITGLALQSSTLTNRLYLHIASDAGLSTADITPQASSANVLPVSQWTWTYKYLERWFPGPRVSAIAAHPLFVLAATTPGTIPSPNDHVDAFVASPLSGYGVAILEQQLWTLGHKAVRLGAIQARHDRHGLVSDCSLKSFGYGASCTNHPSDNNGLWTSLVVVAEAMRYKATGNPEAAALAWHYYEGMRLLNRITGIKGLIARSAIDPNETHSPGGLWTPSTVPEYDGWTWKADASSDEVTGHSFAFTVMSTFMNGTKGASGGNVTEAAELLSDLADYIVSNGYKLIDFTGRPTRWGDWSPQSLNYNRSWSDEHGVNALEILGLVSGALGAAPLVPDAARVARLNAAWKDLYVTNGYQRNILNAKIEAPCDDNYSDDELTFLPYFTWLVAAQNIPADTSPYAFSSLQRTFGIVKPLRSDLWGAITGSIAAKHAEAAAFFEEAVVDDVLWNLRTWPLDLVMWPVMNSHRKDIFFNPNTNRENRHNVASLRILPANERSQGRWNGDPHQLDGGDGMSETDGGVWLLPFWVARANGLIIDSPPEVVDV